MGSLTVIRVSVLFALLAATSSDASIFDPITNFFSNLLSKPTKFTQLQVTLADPTRPLEIGYWFNNIPLTKDEATQKKWTPISTSEGGDCTNGGKYNGFRYIPPTAPSITAIYDSQGVIVGFQTLYDSDKLENGSSHSDCKTKGIKNTFDFASQKILNLETINGVVYKVATAYFVDPTTICTSTRDPSKVSSEGYGNELYFQNGPTPSDLIKAPATRPEAAAAGWTDNKCLPLNGYHNFWHSEQWDDTQCNDVRPAWLFYDEDKKLSGFGFTVPGCDDSPRFQHPPGAIVKYVSGSKCAETVANTVKFSNINVYFTKAINTANDCIDFGGTYSKVKTFLNL